MDYPEARKDDIVDDYHGTLVADPYRWLEDPDSAETGAWVKAQNKLSSAFLEAAPHRQRIKDRLNELWQQESYGVPQVVAGRLFVAMSDGIKAQPVVMMAESPTEEPVVVLDPNEFSDDGTTSLSGWHPSPCGKLLAYMLAEGGSDWNTIRVRNLETGEDIADRVHWVKFSWPAWLADSSGFSYSRFDDPTGATDTAALTAQRVHFHDLGTHQSEDVLVFEDPEHADRGFNVFTTDDGSFHILMIRRGTDRHNCVWIQEADGAPKFDAWRPLFDGFTANYWPVGNVGTKIYVKTDLDAPRARVITIDAVTLEIEEIVAEQEGTLQSVGLLANELILDHMIHAASSISRVHLDGTPLGDVELPSIGSVAGLEGAQASSDSVYVRFSSHTVPPGLYKLEDGTLTVWKQKVIEGLEDLVAEQRFVTSPDGTKVPIVMLYKGELGSATRPVFLYGYGGFRISLSPEFRQGRIPFLELGGVMVVCNLRGGGEYGVPWHDAGRLHNKQNVFDDFIAVAEYLTAEGITDKSKLAIHGRSNGGLLVGAVMVQRPELFGAALPAVGVLDMLRYHEWTIGRAWASDYGLSDDPEMFATLYKYSPLHNARANEYPPTLVMTADHDDRVVPAHSFKFTAALQEAQQGSAPVLARIETRAGHGAGKSVQMAIEELTDMWCFLTATLDFGT